MVILLNAEKIMENTYIFFNSIIEATLPNTKANPDFVEKCGDILLVFHLSIHCDYDIINTFRQKLHYRENNFFNMNFF